MFGGTIYQASPSDQGAWDDLSREVYCVLGMPIDLIDLTGVLGRIDFAAATASTLFLSTPNLNYLVHCLSDLEFRDSMLLSDLSPADGMPIVWLGRLLGVPIKERVAGSDIFAALKALRDPEQPLKLFLFGGNEGVAAAASAASKLQFRPHPIPLTIRQQADATKHIATFSSSIYSVDRS